MRGKLKGMCHLAVFRPTRSLQSEPLCVLMDSGEKVARTQRLLRGSGYLGYVDSNQGYNPHKWVICPLTRVINLHITSY